MEETIESPLTRLLKRELLVSMGCTEPAAAALAAAAARHALGIPPQAVRIRASRDIIKNAMHAGIPHSTFKGINAAAALGVSVGDPAKGLNILSCIGPEDEERAAALLRSGCIELELAEGTPPVFIEVKVQAEGHSATARIQGEHSQVVILKDSGGETMPEYIQSGESYPELSPEALYDYALHVPFAEIRFLIEGARTNYAIAEHSVKTGYGIQVGKTMLEQEGGDLFLRGASLAAAASDARMAGCSMPVVINSGSGNQGITISVPVLVLGEGLGRGEEEITRALCLAHLTALMMTARKDRLSALCGAFTAAVGTAAGYILLLGGGYDDMTRCVNNMVGNLMGILCDGAKGSCALKIYSCVEAAAMGAKIALAGRSIPASEGVLGNNLEETLRTVRQISHEGMIPLDKTILNIMIQKRKQQEVTKGASKN
ncbi:MAG: L-serine ammonia-lyase, iron-sulfur-dependent, subunit alpha [Treponema sp.]|jgi:L-cysteine desulfidase|nr:L-serine ammonia-lyase, iron-sulfur-dependent, subunit alpha [Treponema sp.]